MGALVRVKELLCFIIVVILIPFILFVISPFFIWRQIVCVLAKCFKGGTLASMLNAMDAYFFDPDVDIYKNSKWVVSVLLTMKGHFEKVDFKTRLVESLINAKKEDGSPKYARLRQHPTSWLGFGFFEWDKYFNIDNHLKYVQNEESFTDENLSNFIATHASNPFHENCSLWEIVVCQSVNETRVLFRFQHTVMDGFSMLGLLNELSGLQTTEVISKHPPQIKLSFKEKILYCYQNTVGMPYHWRKYKAKFSSVQGIQRIQVPASESTNPLLFGKVVSKIPIQKIKDAAHFHQVPFSAVIITPLLMSLTKYLNEHVEQDLIPKDLRTFFVVRSSNRLADTLENSLDSEANEAVLSLRQESLLEKLKSVKMEFNKAIRSPGKVLDQGIVKLAGFLPLFIFPKLLMKYHHQQIMLALSNIPGPSTCVKLWNNNVSDIMFCASPNSYAALGICILSYNGNIRIVLSAHKSCIPNQEALNLISRDMELELNNIFQLSETGSVVSEIDCKLKKNVINYVQVTPNS